MKVNYDNLTHKQQCIVNAQSDYDYAKEAFNKVKDAELIGGRSANWFVGTGTKELNNAYNYLVKHEYAYIKVLEALQVTEQQAEQLADGYNRYWNNK